MHVYIAMCIMYECEHVFIVCVCVCVRVLNTSVTYTTESVVKDVVGKRPLQNSRVLRTGLNVLSNMPGQTCAICSQGGQEPTDA